MNGLNKRTKECDKISTKRITERTNECRSQVSSKLNHVDQNQPTPLKSRNRALLLERANWSPPASLLFIGQVI